MKVSLASHDYSALRHSAVDMTRWRGQEQAVHISSTHAAATLLETPFSSQQAASPPRPGQQPELSSHTVRRNFFFRLPAFFFFIFFFCRLPQCLEVQALWLQGCLLQL